MKLLGALLALVTVGLSYSTILAVTAEDFANMTAIKVGADDSHFNHTLVERLVPGECMK
jgi:hypothetical protein